MKKILAITLSVVLVCLSALPTTAKTVTHDTHKSSYQDYAGQGNLKYTATPVFSFDDMSQIKSSNNGTVNTTNKKEGNGALEVNFPNGSNGNVVTAFETKDNAFEFSVSDRKKETVKFWMYINDNDLMSCDHDSVYEAPQKNSATIYVTFGEKSWSQYQYHLQHTFEGSGWHLVEIAFATHNILYENLKNLNLSKVGYMRVRCNAKPGLQLIFDDLQKYTYTNDGYTEPECPKGGRWISTCDFDALDGPVISEWYASSFDLEEKVQGSSSLTLTGHKEHVDTRCVWGGLDVPLNKQYDIFHYDMYISDLDLIGNDYQVRLSQSEGGKGEAHYNITYALANKFSNNGTGLKVGWNSIDIPLLMMPSNIDTSYYKKGIDFRLEHVVMFWTGSSETKNYTVKYDNMYVYVNPQFKEEAAESDRRKAEEEKNASLGASSYKGMTLRESSTEEGEENGEFNFLFLIPVAAAVVIAAALVIVLLLRKKKKPTQPTPPETPTAEEIKTDTDTESEENKNA